MNDYIYVVEKILGRTADEHPREILDGQATIARADAGNAIVQFLRLAQYRARRAVAYQPAGATPTARLELAPFLGKGGQGIRYTAGLLTQGYVVEVALITGHEFPFIRARRQASANGAEAA